MNTKSLFAVTCAMLAAASSAAAADVRTTVSKVGSSTWDVSFSVMAGAGQTVEAFSVYFDWARASNIRVQASPGSWDSIAIEGDASLSADGFFDSLALGAGIASGATLGGFTARLNWLDAGGPGALRYTINDPMSFAALESGTTVAAAAPMAPIPEPSTWALMAFGLAATCAAQKRRRLSL